MATFQNKVNSVMPAGVPGTLVQVAGVKKFVKGYIAQDNTVTFGKFVQAGSEAGTIIGLGAQAKTVIGIALLDQYVNSNVVPSMLATKGSVVNVASEGVVAYEVTNGFSYADGGTIVAVTTATGVVSVVTAVGAGQVDTLWRVIQEPTTPTAEQPGVMYIKK